MPKQMKIDEFLARIRKKCESRSYIFRGTPRRYSGQLFTDILSGEKKKDGISSSLYRRAKKTVPFYEHYRPFNIEEEILERAKKRAESGASNIEVLTDLQHLGQNRGRINIIDFSRNIDIALFFACDGEYRREGELIFLDLDKIGKARQDILYEDLRSLSDPFPIEPAKTQLSQKRVLFQSSIFVYPPYGYINKDLCEFERVPAYLKEDALAYLKKMHGVNTDTVYNDMIGFVANEDNYESTAHLYYDSISIAQRGDYEGAIKKLDKAEELAPRHSNIFTTRGGLKNSLGRTEDAILDFSKAIELDGNDMQAHGRRGSAKLKLALNNMGIHDSNRASTLESAIVDLSRAIELASRAIELNKDVIVICYCDRAEAKSHLSRFQEAIADCDEAIKLDEESVKAHILRIAAKKMLGLVEEAKKDLNVLIALKNAKGIQ